MSDIALNEPRNISNSEVTTWLTCRQMYDFAFNRNLAPKITPKQLSRGTLGHEAFSFYIAARLEGATHEQALRAMNRSYENALRAGVGADVVLETRILVDRYMAFHNGWPAWKLLGTEQRVDLPINSDFSVPITYDLLIEEISSGKRLLGDFKFTYDFWSPDDHSLNPQAPKYIAVMNANGIRVDGGFLEEVRTRPLGVAKRSDHKNLWRRTHYYPSLAKKRNMMKQHITACMEIVEFRSMSPEEQELEAIPVLSKHGACKFCNFKDLCASKLDGKDITFDIEYAYTQNTYGYNATVPLELEII